MKSILVRVPDELKRRLDAVRAEGYTLNGYIVCMLERELKSRGQAQGRHAMSRVKKRVR